MNDLDAMYRAVVAYPDEDTPRLAYADALDEHANATGDKRARTRAAYIRAALASGDDDNFWCERTGTHLIPHGHPELEVEAPAVPDAMERCRCGVCSVLRARAKVARAALPPWVKEVAASIAETTSATGATGASYSVAVAFRRGLPSILGVSAPTFDVLAGPLFALLPVTNVHIRRCTPTGGRRTGWTVPADALPVTVRTALGWSPPPTWGSPEECRRAIRDALLTVGRRERDRLWAAGS